MRSFFNNFKSNFNHYVGTPFLKYLATPTGKITLINSLLLVHLLSFRYHGTLREFLRVFWLITSLLKERTSVIIDCTLYSLMLFLIFQHCILVFSRLFSNRHACFTHNRKTNCIKIRR